jgi:hypothetical protein
MCFRTGLVLWEAGSGPKNLIPIELGKSAFLSRNLLLPMGFKTEPFFSSEPAFMDSGVHGLLFLYNRISMRPSIGTLLALSPRFVCCPE